MHNEKLHDYTSNIRPKVLAPYISEQNNYML